MLYVLYLLVLSSLLFITQDRLILGGLLALQIFLWLYSGVGLRRGMKMLKRIWLFLLVVLVAYAFVPTGSDADQWHTILLSGYAVEINLSGLMLAVFMCGRILCLVMASTWVQHAVPADVFLSALQRLGVPESVAMVLKHALALVGGGGKGKGKGDANKDKPKMRALLKGDLTPVSKLLDWAFERTDKRLAEQEPDMPASMRNDVSVMLAMTLAMMSFKMIVLVPGLMVAPGHKNVILIPLFLIAAQRTHARFGAMWTGLCMGLVNFLLGFGKLGILELAQFMLTGLLADLLLPYCYSSSRWLGLTKLAIIGALMGLARFSTNVLLLLLAGAPMVGFAIFMPILISQILFGALSAVPSRVLLASKPD